MMIDLPVGSSGPRGKLAMTKGLCAAAALRWKLKFKLLLFLNSSNKQAAGVISNAA